MIARKSALIVLTQVLNGILGYIGLKFIASYMQPWEYGVVGFAYGFVALFSISRSRHTPSHDKVGFPIFRVTRSRKIVPVSKSGKFWLGSF